MVEMLTELVTNENLAWNKLLEKYPEKFIVKLSDDTINELLNNRTKLEDGNVENFCLLKKEILEAKKNILLQGCGVFIVAGKNFKLFSKEEQKFIHIIISKILGKLVIQSTQNDLFIEVKDIGRSLEEGGRYHQTKQGGSYHTDGYHMYEDTPNYVGLLCINPAKEGGASKFVSAYTIHNNLLKNNKELLKILYEKVYIDKREYKEGESKVRYDSTFEYHDGKLFFKYQREYVDRGYKIINQEMSEQQKLALDELDKALQIEDNILTYDFKAGDMMFSNNKWLIHDRTDFVDYDDPDLKRTLIRTWIREEQIF